MTFYATFTIACLVLSCVAGYWSACNGVLQGVPLVNKVSYRFAQFCGTLLVLVVVWFHTPNLWLACIPVGVCAAYLLAVTAYFRWAKRPDSEEEGPPLHHEGIESFLHTGTAVMLSAGITQTALTYLAWMPRFRHELQVSFLDRWLCYGLLLGIVTFLLCMLLHTLILFQKYPKDDANHVKLELRKKLKTPPTIP